MFLFWYQHLNLTTLPNGPFRKCLSLSFITVHGQFLFNRLGLNCQVTIWHRKHKRKTPSQAFTISKQICIGWSLKFCGTVHVLTFFVTTTFVPSSHWSSKSPDVVSRVWASLSEASADTLPRWPLPVNTNGWRPSISSFKAYKTDK